jgi:hypothetical protein
MIGGAFQPQGNTVAITSAATSTTPVQVPNSQGAGGLGPAQFLIQVVGAVPMFFTWGSAASGTAPAAVIPVNGTPGNGFLVQAGGSKVITAQPGAWFATIATATTSTAYITPGDGN